MNAINELIARWNSDEGKPYKGKLIDRDNYAEGNLSCMCTQGQVLHVVGGWSADMLAEAERAFAGSDAELVNGMIDGRDPSTPEPSANRHPAYRHAWDVHRAEIEGRPIPAALSRARIEHIEAGGDYYSICQEQER